MHPLETRSLALERRLDFLAGSDLRRLAVRLARRTQLGRAVAQKFFAAQTEEPRRVVVAVDERPFIRVEEDDRLGSILNERAIVFFAFPESFERATLSLPQ